MEKIMMNREHKLTSVQFISIGCINNNKEITKIRSKGRGRNSFEY